MASEMLKASFADWFKISRISSASLQIDYNILFGFFEAISFSARSQSQMFEHLVSKKDLALAKRGNSEEAVKGQKESII